MKERNPFHDGERYMQERAGERETALRNGVLVGEAIPPRAILFLSQQRMLAIGSVDERGTVWASVLLGAQSFVSSSDGRSVVIDRTRVHATGDDPLWSNLRVGEDVGLLAIDLESRRRLRMNGMVDGVTDRRIEVSIRDAYPNCPKYIQRRHVREDPGARPIDQQPLAHGRFLDEVRSRVVERADTLFVASRHPTRGVDISHRGGAPGFVRVLNATELRLPDYRGNSMFNTLGNFVVDNRAGLVVLDFDRRRLLQMTGTVVVRFDEEEHPRQPTGGTGRYWDFHVGCWLELPVAMPIAWDLLDSSAYNPIPRV